MKKKFKIIIPFLVFLLIGIFIKNTAFAVTDPNINFRYNITNNEFLQNDINFPSYCYNLPFITTKNIDDYAISLYYKHNVNNVYLFYHYIFRNDTVIEKKYDENNIYIFIDGYRKIYCPYDVSKNSSGQYTNRGSSYDNNFSKWKIFFVFDKNTRQLRFWEQKDGYTGNVLPTLEENILNYPNIKYVQNYNLLRADFNFNYDSFNQWISPLDFENPRTLYGRQLIDKENFIQWIKSNNKQSSFVDYGISTSSNYVENLINLYEANDPVQFFIQIPSFLIDNQSIFSSVEVARGLFNLIDNLYQEYKLSQISQIKQVDTNSNLLPHHRIDSSTDIYIENATDTIDIKILRDILKTLIQTPYTLYTLFDYYLYNISNNTHLAIEYLNELPSYITDLIYNKFISPLNSIIYAIENIDNGGGTTSIDVIIPNEKEVEFNDFLNLWNNNFNDIIDNKFPVANQLSSLFDDFFVKAGISTDKDDMIYSYYNPNTVGSTVDSNLSDFYSIFDDANTSYLNDVGYSDDIPSLSIKIKGVKTEIINFKFYAKYRQQIFTIMSFILWFAFLLSLYKSLPTIIGNVSDITNTLDEFESKIDKGDNF